MGILLELFEFMKERRKVFLWPVVLVMVLIGGVLVFAQGSALAPFVYTLF